MNKNAVVFLLVVAPFLAALLACLGLATVKPNPMDWFLITVGVVYIVGIILSPIIRGRKFWESGSGGETKKEEKNDRSFWFITLGMALVFFISPTEYLFFHRFTAGEKWIPFIGLGVVIMGTMLFVWARRTLRHAYSGHLEVKETQPLVQTGPYRILRHPAYAGYLLMALGLVIGYTSLLGLIAIILLLIPATIFRVKVEEKMLTESFGDEYTAYRSKTKRILPFIW